MINIRRISGGQKDISQVCTELRKDKWQTLEYSAEINNLKNFLNDENNFLLLAYQGDVVAGMLTAHKLMKIDQRVCEIMLYEIEVKNDFRGMGIGKELMRILYSYAVQQSASEIWVLTDKDNVAANRLYESALDNFQKQDQVIYIYPIEKKKNNYQRK